MARKNEAQAIEYNRARQIQEYETNALAQTREKFHQMAVRGGLESLLGVPVDGSVWEWNSEKKVWTMPAKIKWATWVRKQESDELIEVKKKLKETLEKEQREGNAAQQMIMRRENLAMRQGENGGPSGPSGQKRQDGTNGPSGMGGKNIGQKKRVGPSAPSANSLQNVHNGQRQKTSKGGQSAKLGVSNIGFSSGQKPRGANISRNF